MTHFLGPVLNREKFDGLQAWFSKMPLQGSPNHVVYYNDFLVAQDYAAGDWVVTETDSSATQALAADELNGALLLTNSGTDDHVVQLQSAEEFLKLSVGKRVWFETKVKISDATLADMFVGFATTDTSIIAGTTDSVGFRKLSGSTSIGALTEDNTTETLTAVATATTGYVTLGFAWDGINAVRFYVNRSLVATHTTNVEQTNKLALTVTLQNGEGAAKTMTIDYLYVCQER